MGELKDRLTRDLELRNLAAPTKREYLRCCSNFVRYHSEISAMTESFLVSLEPRAVPPSPAKGRVTG